MVFESTDFMSRRLLKRFVVALLALSTGLGAGAAEAPLKHVSIMLDWYPEAENGGYYCALVSGLYRAAGLDVEIVPAAPNAAVEPQVALGKMDFGLGSSDVTLIARSRGIPLVAVMGSIQHDPVGVMVHDESPVHTFADLEGHTVAVQPGEPWFSYVVKKFNLQNVRVTPLSFDYAPFLHDPGYIQQCFITSEPPIMKHMGIKVRWLWVKESGTDPYMALDTSDRFLAENPDAVRAFVSATIAGWRGYLANPAAADAEILRRNPAMSQLQLDLSRQVMIEYHLIDGDAAGSEIGKVDPKRFQRQYRILRDLGIIAKDFDYQKAYSTEYLPKQ
jgi:NitT/TauT family transport system substrate-binding protein